jgi:hypothetical protein
MFHEILGHPILYAVTNLDLEGGNAPAFLVRIKADFGSWQVTRVQ